MYYEFENEKKKNSKSAGIKSEGHGLIPVQKTMFSPVCKPEGGNDETCNQRAATMVHSSTDRVGQNKVSCLVGSVMKKSNEMNIEGSTAVQSASKQMVCREAMAGSSQKNESSRKPGEIAYRS